jgi:hypothetical protein
MKEPTALQLGWSMAVLYGPIRPPSTATDQLPTEHELDVLGRIDFELHRMGCLLDQLVANPDPVAVVSDTDAAKQALADAWAATSDSEAMTARRSRLDDALKTLNKQILSGLACVGSDVELAYQLGRSLRDTVALPWLKNHASRNDDEIIEGLKAQLGRRRVATMQQWLATLTPQFPAHTTAIVSTSLGRWSDLADAGLTSSLARRGTTDELATQMCSHLLPQGDVWMEVLTGDRSADGLLSPEGYVAAGEATLSRTSRIVLRILRHYWFALLILAVALAATLYVSARYLGGAGRVWTQIAAIAGSLGITARGIGSAMSRMAKSAERPIFGLEQEDVMAWTITSLPEVRLTGRGVRRLRRSGVAPSVGLGHL